ncbi:uncharacterized protein LOC123867685 [Maniola jurtina]|uniref:uncharacterized protein LOC123867685 n=1 Tax=Maniola jurtina TaxID=191418 RepID=UPI001E68BDD9|nr:uncharacterized protein LOC123867685 [Maniola jurtina]
MAARRLVLNGLTAEVSGAAGAAGDAGAAGAAGASPEFYHELELYRQLLALPEAPRRSRTPDPPPPRSRHGAYCVGEAGAVPAAAGAARGAAPQPHARPAAAAQQARCVLRR